ncbi:hypothetical protein [Streptomyces sp. NPDC006368]|uniref:hypothetical protein n=1 Tax=Streptomyces sp. NPDC006368 TaxID=3156760 RepID=UPI0033A0A164
MLRTRLPQAAAVLALALTLGGTVATATDAARQSTTTVAGDMGWQTAPAELNGDMGWQ